MTDADRLRTLRDSAETAEAIAENRRLQIEWLAGELARRVGTAIRDDGVPICFDLPEEIRDQLCPNGCAECWADAAEVAVTPLEAYLKPEYQERGFFWESAQEFMERKRRESRAGKAQKHERARVIQFRRQEHGDNA